jgi:hypothetical protein
VCQSGSDSRGINLAFLFQCVRLNPPGIPPPSIPVRSHHFHRERKRDPPPVELIPHLSCSTLSLSRVQRHRCQQRWRGTALRRGDGGAMRLCEGAAAAGPYGGAAARLGPAEMRWWRQWLCSPSLPFPTGYRPRRGREIFPEISPPCELGGACETTLGVLSQELTERAKRSTN